MKLNKFGYSQNNSNMDCGIKKIIDNNFYIYDKNKKKWINSYDSSDYDLKEFTIATWNLWGSAHFDKISFIDKRLKYIINLLKKENLTIICLQEISKKIINKLCNTKFIKDNYYISSIDQPWISDKIDLPDSSYKDNEPNCWSIILSKIPVNKSNYIVLKSDKIEFSTVVAEFNNLTIVNLHLQSGGLASGLDKKVGLKYHHCRQDQMKEIKEFISKNYNSKNIIYTGDFNFDLNKNKLFPERSKIINKLKDSWIETGNDGKDGTTENTYINTMRYNIKGLHKNYRYDGILYNSKILKPIESRLFGTQSIFDISKKLFKIIFNKDPLIINDKNRIDWYLSDHFGIITKFKF